MKNISVVIGTTHCPIHFPRVTMQVKNASTEKTAKPQPVITDHALMIPPRATKKHSFCSFVNHPSEWNITGIVTPVEKFTETASLLIS